MAKKTNSKNIVGPFIYKDNKNGIIYYDIFSKKGYIINNKNVDKYQTYFTSIIIFVLMVFFVMVYGIVNFMFGIGLILAGLLVAHIALRHSYLSKLSFIENYTPINKNNIFTYISNNFSIKKILLMIFISSILAILIYFCAIRYEYLSNQYLSNMLIFIICILFILLLIVGLIIKISKH